MHTSFFFWEVCISQSHIDENSLIRKHCLYDRNCVSVRNDSSNFSRQRVWLSLVCYSCRTLFTIMKEKEKGKERRKEKRERKEKNPNFIFTLASRSKRRVWFDLLNTTVSSLGTQGAKISVKGKKGKRNEMIKEMKIFEFTGRYKRRVCSNLLNTSATLAILGGIGRKRS